MIRSHSRRSIQSAAMVGLALIMLIPAARPPSANAATKLVAIDFNRSQSDSTQSQVWTGRLERVPSDATLLRGQVDHTYTQDDGNSLDRLVFSAVVTVDVDFLQGAVVSAFGTISGQQVHPPQAGGAIQCGSPTIVYSGAISGGIYSYNSSRLGGTLFLIGTKVDTFTGFSTSDAAGNVTCVPVFQREFTGTLTSFRGTHVFGTDLTVSIGDAVALEGAPGAGNALSFPVSLSAPAPATAGGVSVNFGTAYGTAQAGSDYNVNSGTLTFAAGEQQKFVTVQVVGDAANEPDETVFVTLSNPTAGATLARPTATGTIINDDLVDFDWTVPDRFGLDANLDSLIDYFTTAASISPPTWRVDFVYSAGGVCNPALSPSLTIDGVVISSSDPAILATNSALCGISYAFPAEKKYAVKLELRNAAGATAGELTKDVIVQDWLIVSLGDSVASGEGNPDIPRTTLWGSPVWQNRQCHRTAFAGPAQAALAIERADPKTSVTFVHLACSGASIYEGILTRYRGQEPRGWIPPQVEVMDALVGSREIDAVTVSTGANDVRFAKVVEDCFNQQDCHLPTTRNSMLQFFEGGLALLPSAYNALGLTLRHSRYDVAADRLYITEYFDALRDQNGAFCDETILEEAFQFPGRGISAAESRWASTDMMVRLNQQVAAHAGRAGWKYIGGINTPFRPHGYCSTDRWIVQLTESLANQGNRDGTIHPNREGHAFYGTRISTALTSDFYLAGDLTKPRPPR